MSNVSDIKVEDVLADTSRVALSYQIFKENGKVINPEINFFDGENGITAYSQTGKPIEDFGMSWMADSDYGLIELSLRGYESVDSLTIVIDLTELNGKNGNWQLEIPVDLSEVKDRTTKLVLDEQVTTEHGVGIHLQEVQFAPSSNDIIYETYFTEEEKAKVEEQIQELGNSLGDKHIVDYMYYDTAIQYHIENENSEVLYSYNLFHDAGHPSDVGMIQGTGEEMGELGHVKWNDSFHPQKEEEQLTFVLDGVIKTVPSDFSIKINPKKLKKQPLSFEYEGNFMDIKELDIKTEYEFQKAFPPIETEKVLAIEMEGGKEAASSELVSWGIVDDKGDIYEASYSMNTLDEKDENGRFKTSITLFIDGIEELPEELTLHLLSVRRFEKVEEEWKVPLYE